MLITLHPSSANTGKVAAHGEFGRRELMVFGVGLVLGAAGCTSPRQHPNASEPVTSAPLEAPQPSRSPSVTRSPVRVALPKIRRWRPNVGDIEPEAKATAVGVIEAIGSWPRGEAGLAAAESRVAALDEAGSLVGQAPSLLHAASGAVIEIIDAQYGGLLADTASVLVAFRQWWANDRVVATGGTTVDVRLSRLGGQWRVTALHPAHPGRAALRVSAVARHVLSSGRIELPPASVADVRSGQVHDSVLNALLILAKDYSIGVSVIRSGHPKYVFGTSRLSDHPRGRAFDTWRINGHAVVDPATPKKLITSYMEAAAAAGSYNVGGPYQLAGSGNHFFSDATHHDHIHTGFVR